MPLREHLIELRQRMIKAIFFLILGGIAGWFLYPSIITLLKEPYCQIPIDHRGNFGGPNGGCALPFFGPLDGFVLRFKVAGIAGLVLSSPFWLYQLWAFITPGLRRNERRWTVLFVFSSTILFAAGAVLSYFTLGKALTLLVNISGPGTIAVIEITRYIGFVMTMLFVFGVSFELPLLVVMLNQVGIVSAQRLLRWQRLAIFLIFVFAAVATPSQDPISMCMLAIPMCLLFEVAILIAWLHDRRKARREADESFHDLADDAASPLDLTRSPLEDVDSTGR